MQERINQTPAAKKTLYTRQDVIVKTAAAHKWFYSDSISLITRCLDGKVVQPLSGFHPSRIISPDSVFSNDALAALRV